MKMSEKKPKHSTSTPDKHLNRQVFLFYEFCNEDEVPRPVEL